MKKIAIVVFLGLLACKTGNKEKAPDMYDKITVAVTNYPLFFMANEIGGPLVSVYLPALGGDPAYWKPDAEVISNYQNAELIFLNGATFEKWADKVSLPASKVVITSLTFKDRWIETDDAIVHSHGPEGMHTHKGTAFTTWLNFDLAIKQAEAIHQALLQKFPDEKAQLDANLETLRKSLSDLSARMKAVALQLSGKGLIASHPVYHYLIDGYGLQISSLHWEPDAMPEEAEWEVLKQLMEGTGANIMIWEGEPLEEILVRSQGLGIKAVVFDPCANRPVDGDFLTAMEANLSGLEEAAGIR